MGVIRNFIEIEGLAVEDDLPKKSLGQFVKYNETETICIPEDKPGIKDIFQIAIEMEVKSKRIINSNDMKTVVIDGAKKLKIVYSQDICPDKLVMLSLTLPYNTFIEIPNEVGDVENIYIHILDAYFEVLDKQRIYGHFLYLLDARYAVVGMDVPSRKNMKQVELLSLEEANDSDVPQIAISHEDFFTFDAEKNNLSNDIACLYL